MNVSLEATESSVKIRVHNEGDPIPDTIQDQLFRPSRQTQRGKMDDKANWGIGLTIVRRLLKEQGGTLSVESALNRGTTFIAELPRTRPSAEHSAQSSKTSAN